MDTILFDTGCDIHLSILAEGGPGVLLPLVDRPFAQQVIEYLVCRGMNHIHIVSTHRGSGLERALGDGKRWGVSLTFGKSLGTRRPYSFLKRADVGEKPEHVLVGHIDRLPSFIAADWEAALDCPGPVLFYRDAPAADGPESWTGWVVLERSLLPQLNDARSEREVLDAIGAAAGGKEWVSEVVDVLDVRKPHGLLDATRAVLRDRFRVPLHSGRELQPGVWVSPRARVHPTARLLSPLFIGEHATIGRAATVGPDVVVSCRCAIAEETQVQRSLILPDTYVGPDLDLCDVIVSKNLLVNVRLEALTKIHEPGLLANIAGQSG
jgi:mannose-1-phosphate guanylyltransferase